MPFRSHLTMDTLPSAVPTILRPAIRYSRFWIWRPSSEHQRDFNPPEQCAAQRTLRRSPTSPARACPSCGLAPSRTGLRKLPKACWRSPGSRACCFISVRGFLDYAGPDNCSRVTQPPYCLPPTRKGVGILIFRLFEAQSPGPPMPLSTLRMTPRDVTRKTRGQDGFATSFPAGPFTPTTCRFIPALSGLAVTRLKTNISLPFAIHIHLLSGDDR
jgi:hypothetical protein